MKLAVYLSGEIHTDWREKIIQGCQESDLNIVFSSAVTHHEASDSAGDHLGAATAQVWATSVEQVITTLKYISSN